MAKTEVEFTCEGVQQFTRVCQQCARVCYSVQEYIRGCNSMHGLCEGMQQCTKVYKDECE